MSYLEFFQKNVKKDNESIKGICLLMCPQEEVIMRHREKLVHVLEVCGSERRLVKSFSRSAADANMAQPSLLRPFNVLQKTIQHLLFNVTKRTDVTTSVLYDFVDDRLRAVRQDMTIQRLPSEQCVQLLEPMIRFYVFYGYKLCDAPLKDYDPVLNKKHLLECTKWFLSCCNDLKQKQSRNDLSDYLSSLALNNSYDRPLVESLYILCHLDDVYPLFRYTELPQNLKNEPTLQLTYKIGIANLNGNFVQLSRLMDELCPLTYCALCLHLPKIQRRALSVLSAAYSKQLLMPLSAVAEWVGLSGGEEDGEVAALCKLYRHEVVGDEVRFVRGQDVPMHPPMKLERFEKKFDLSPSHVFTYTTYKK